MTHSLRQRVDAVRRKAWLYGVLRGGCLVIACGVLLVAVGGGLDFWLRFEDQGMRFLLTGAVGAGIAWAAWRLLRPRLTRRLSLQTVSARIEREYPELTGALTSALEFLDEPENDPRAGSAALRRATIARTDGDCHDVDFSKALRPRPLMRAASLAVLLLAAVVAFCLALPDLARTAAVRLANPLSAVQWPRATNLALRSEITTVPRGGAFEIQVIDTQDAPFPDDIRMQVRYRGTARIEEITLRPADDELRYRRDNVVRPFEYRAVGGDDEKMEWTSLEVIEPPAVQSLALELHPPDYTGWAIQPSTGRIEALAGTRVALRGVANKRLRSAEIVLSPEVSIPTKIGDDGFSFSVPFPQTEANDVEADNVEANDGEADDVFAVTASGSYSVRLVDINGYASANEARYEIRAIADNAPKLAIEDPPGDLVATSNAVLPVSLSAVDDLLLRDVEVRYERSDQSGEGTFSIPLYKRTDVPAVDGEWPMWSAQDDAQELTHAWNLADLNLPPGARITFYATASDFAGQVGQSSARRLTIVTQQQMLDRLAEEQSFIVEELARVLSMQHSARGELGEIQVQLNNVGKLTSADIDALQSVELTQRGVERSLLDEADGVRGHVQRVLAEIVNNRVDSPDVNRRMAGILDAINRLAAQPLPQTEAALTAAIKDAQFADAEELPAGELQSLTDSVNAATAGQDQVISELETVLGELSRWNNYRRFFREFGQIRQQQEDLAQEIAAAGTLGRRPDQLTSQQRADLAKLQSRHDELARRLETLQGQMPPVIESLRETDPLAADVLSDALALAQSAALGQQFRRAGNEVAQNRISTAMRTHEEIGELLGEMLDVLANKREHELARLQRKLDQAWQDLRNARQQQQGLRKQAEDAAASADPRERARELERLTQQQRELQAEADRMARQLDRLRSQQASNSSASAARQMGSAADDAQSGDAASAADAMAKAEQDLEDAEQLVNEQRKQLERDLAEELVTKTLDALRGLRERQFSLAEESRRIHNLRDSASQSLTRGQLMSLRDAARDQALLEAESRALADRIEPIPAFAAALVSTADQMRLAAELLEQQDEATALLRQQDALRRLDQLLDALKPQPNENADGNASQGNEGSGGEDQQSAAGGDGIPRVAQLRLLKLMQEALNVETSALFAEIQTSVASGGAITPAQQQRLTALANEQGRLADLILEMSKPPQDDPLQELNELDDGGGQFSPRAFRSDRMVMRQIMTTQTQTAETSPRPMNFGWRHMAAVVVSIGVFASSAVWSVAASSSLPIGLQDTGGQTGKTQDDQKTDDQKTDDQQRKDKQGDSKTDQSDQKTDDQQKDDKQDSDQKTGDDKDAGQDKLDKDLFDDLGGLFDDLGDAQKGTDDQQEDDQEFFDSLGQGEDIGEEGDPLIRIGQRMRQVESLLGGAEAGENIQLLQQQIAADLDRLIAQAQQQQQQQSQGSQSAGNENSSGDNSQSGANAAQAQSQATAQQAGNTAGMGQVAQDSQDQARPAGPESASMAAIRDLLEKTPWGDLPERIRQTMQQLPQEQMLPEYAAQIHEYFRQLAKKSGRAP